MTDLSGPDSKPRMGSRLPWPMTTGRGRERAGDDQVDVLAAFTVHVGEAAGRSCAGSRPARVLNQLRRSRP